MWSARELSELPLEDVMRPDADAAQSQLTTKANAEEMRSALEAKAT